MRKKTRRYLKSVIVENHKQQATIHNLISELDGYRTSKGLRQTVGNAIAKKQKEVDNLNRLLEERGEERNREVRRLHEDLNEAAKLSGPANDWRELQNECKEAFTYLQTYLSADHQNQLTARSVMVYCVMLVKSWRESMSKEKSAASFVVWLDEQGAKNLEAIRAVMPRPDRLRPTQHVPNNDVVGFALGVAVEELDRVKSAVGACVETIKEADKAGTLSGVDAVRATKGKRAAKPKKPASERIASIIKKDQAKKPAAVKKAAAAKSVKKVPVKKSAPAKKVPVKKAPAKKVPVKKAAKPKG